MGRNATIKIQNNTKNEFKFVTETVEHGKFQKDAEPPKSIPSHDEVSFEVGNRTGAKVGPKGNVVYSTLYTGKKEDYMDKPVNLIIEWDHPFSASTSTYRCYSQPEGLIFSTLNPPKPTGHNQDIEFTIEFV